MALCAPPACVRDAMMRVQLEVGSLQDETLVSSWLDFACKVALNANQLKDAREDEEQQYSEERMTKTRRLAPELLPCTRN